MSDPNFEMSLSEFLGQWGFTMDDARNVAERLGIFNLEELRCCIPVDKLNLIGYILVFIISRLKFKLIVITSGVS